MIKNTQKFEQEIEQRRARNAELCARKEHAKPDWGWGGKISEMLSRDVGNIKGNKMWKSRPVGKHDFAVCFTGEHYLRIEVKTGNGALGYRLEKECEPPFTDADRTDTTQMLAKADFVAYHANPVGLIDSDEPAVEQLARELRIVPRNEFLDLLGRMRKSGIWGATKIDKRGYQLTMALGSWNHPTGGALRKFWAILESQYPTLPEWLESNGRAVK